jgi:hypothetical protein
LIPACWNWRHPAAVDTAHKPDSPLIVEWRALTVALLDEIADAVRKNLRSRNWNWRKSFRAERGLQDAGSRQKSAETGSAASQN